MREQIVKNVEKDFLEPSFRYFVENGLENTSIRDLCKAMGVSYGSLYYWFEGKDDFYTSVMGYGIEKVAGKLFKVAFERLQEPELFFNTFLDEIDKYIVEMRVVFQFAASPEYGNMLRNKTLGFKELYGKYISGLSELLNINEEKTAPIVYLLISILSDYVLWEDKEASQMQLRFLYDNLMALSKE